MNKKLLISFFCIILASLIFIMPVFADSPPGKGVMEGAVSNPWNGNGQFKDAGNKVLGIIQLIGNAFAIGTLIIMGVRYMTAAPSEKADIKKSIIPYLIGAILVFAAVNVAGLMAEIADTFK